MLLLLVLTLATQPVALADTPGTPASTPPAANPVVLQYIGHSAILITTPGKMRVISDPYKDHPIGLNDFPRRMGADLVTVSHAHPDHNNIAGVWGTPEVFFVPGVYQVGDVKITGYKADHGLLDGHSQGSNIVFVFETNGVKIVNMGGAGLVTQPDILAALKDADVVLMDCVGDASHPVQDQIEQLLELGVRTILPAHYSYENELPYYGSATLSQFLAVLPSDLPVVKQETSTLNVTPNMPRQVTVLAPFANEKK